MSTYSFYFSNFYLTNLDSGDKDVGTLVTVLVIPPCNVDYMVHFLHSSWFRLTSVLLIQSFVKEVLFDNSTVTRLPKVKSSVRYLVLFKSDTQSVNSDLLFLLPR